MSYVLRYKDYEEDDRYVYFEYLEEVPEGGYFMSAGKWNNAQKFESKVDAQLFQDKFDDLSEYEVVKVE